MAEDILASLLKPPPTCLAYMGLPSRDKRRGGLWYCDHARKITGKGRNRPACLCAAALSPQARKETET